VDSVLRQSFQDFEAILVDDGSPDNSGRICDEYARQDSRVRVIHKKNGGLSDARNYGIEAAEGEYILFIDSDDRFSDDSTLASLHKVISDSHPDLIFYSTNDIYSSGEVRLARGQYPDLRGLSKKEAVNRIIDCGKYPGAAWIIGIRSEVLKSNDIYFPVGYTAEDYIWILKAIRYSETIATSNDAIVDHYQEIPGSITSCSNPNGIKGIHLAIDYWLSSRREYAWPAGIDSMILKMFMVAIINYAGLSKGNKQDVKPLLDSDKRLLNLITGKKATLLRLCLNTLGLDVTSRLLTFAYNHAK